MSYYCCYVRLIRTGFATVNQRASDPCMVMESKARARESEDGCRGEARGKKRKREKESWRVRKEPDRGFGVGLLLPCPFVCLSVCLTCLLYTSPSPRDS